LSNLIKITVGGLKQKNQTRDKLKISPAPFHLKLKRRYLDTASKKIIVSTNLAIQQMRKAGCKALTKIPMLVVDAEAK